MARLRYFLLVFSFFIAIDAMAGAPDIRLEIDSIVYDNLFSPGDSASIQPNDSSFSIFCHLYNDSFAAISVEDTGLHFQASNGGVLINGTNLTDIVLGTVLLRGDSVALVLNLLNKSSSPLPDLVPGGSSVVIWPVFSNGYTTDSVSFTLYYDAPRGVQGISITIDSIRHDTTLYNSILPSTVVGINTSGPDSITIFATIFNNTSYRLSLDSISFGGSIGGDSLTPAQFYQDSSYAGDTIGTNDSFPVALIISNNGSPLPVLLPGGSSVVIWPVYSAPWVSTGDSARFLLGYDTVISGINKLADIYSSVSYNSQIIHIVFSSVSETTMQLYDAIGRKVYEGKSNSATAEIDWSALSADVYILRLRQGGQSVSVKLLHY